jgi:hypothetical protein
VFVSVGAGDPCLGTGALEVGAPVLVGAGLTGCDVGDGVGVTVGIIEGCAVAPVSAVVPSKTAHSTCATGASAQTGVSRACGYWVRGAARL